MMWYGALVLLAYLRKLGNADESSHTPSGHVLSTLALGDFYVGEQDAFFTFSSTLDVERYSRRRQRLGSDPTYH